MKKNTCILVLLISAIGIPGILHAAAPDLADEPAYTAKKLPAGFTLTFDGVGDETAWDNSDEAASLGWNTDGITKEFEETDISFKWKALWDDEKLYLLITVIDDVVLKRHTDYAKDDVEAWMGDCIELFFNPTGSRQPDGEDTYALTKASQHRLVPGQESEAYEITCDQDYITMVFNSTYGYEIDYPGTGYIAEIWYTWDAILPDEMEFPNPWGFTINVNDPDDVTTKIYPTSLWAGAGLGDQQWLSVNYFGLLYLSDDSCCIPDTNNTNINKEYISDVKIYPNPADDFITIETPLNDEMYFEIFDILGKKYMHGYFSNEQKIDVSELKTGSYFVKINGNNYSTTRHIVIN